MESEGKRGKKADNGHFSNLWRQISHHIAPVSLFIVLPVMLALYLVINAIWLERDRHIEQLDAELETRLTQLNCEIDPVVFLKKIARGAWFKLVSHKNRETELAGYFKSLQKFFPYEFDLYAFSPSGKLITPSEINLRSKYLASRLWEILACSPIEQNRKFQKIKRSLRSFVGDEFRISQFLEGRDSCLPIIVKHRKGYVYWKNSQENPSHGVLVFFWEIPDHQYMLKKVKDRINSDFASGFLFADGSVAEKFGVLNKAPANPGVIFARIADMGQNAFFDDSNLLWKGRKVGNCWLLASMKAETELFVNKQRFFSLLAVLLIILASAVYLWASGNSLVYFSIRLKLIILFLTAVASPIMGFVYLGYRYIDDREQNLRSLVSNNSRKLLFELDESFKDVGNEFLDDFASLSNSVSQKHSEEFLKNIHARMEKNDLISIELRDAETAEIKYFMQNEMYFEGMREVSDAFSRFCIDNTLGSSLADAVDPILEMVVRSPEAGLNFFFHRPKEVHKMEFGPVPLFIFWEIFDGLEGKPVYVYIVQSAARLLKQLMARHLTRSFLEKRNAPYILAASHGVTGEWFPAGISTSKSIKDFTQRIFFADQPMETTAMLKGEEYIITGQKGRYAKDYALYSFYPVKLIKNDIRIQIRILFTGIMLFVIVALLTGWLLSDIFLVPVERLGHGVLAIRNRDSSFRIEASQKDEFGDLAVSFNHMIEDLKEMQLAKDVQESLLPALPPEIPGYEVSFANRMASAVGGDYFDVHLIEQNKVFIVIGDVTGHGVGSALVMAMARAIFYQGLKEGRGLLDLFNDLNLAIYEYFSVPPVRKMITLFAAFIDLSDGCGEFVNAGHNFPVKMAADGTCEHLESVHLPIGAVKKLRKLFPKKFSIEKEETIVFYTDGLIEVKDRSDRMLGYEKFIEHLEKQRGKSAENISQALLSLYEDWLSGNEPDDDLTMIVFRRL